MEEKPKAPLPLRPLPAPGSWARTAAGGFIAICAMSGMMFNDQTGLIVGLIVGTAISIGALLFWATRPQ